MPASVAEPLAKVARPVTLLLVGTPSEYASLYVSSVRDWVDVQWKFQAGLVDALLDDRVASTSQNS